jgi:hypothetical protein
VPVSALLFKARNRIFAVADFAGDLAGLGRPEIHGSGLSRYGFVFGFSIGRVILSEMLRRQLVDQSGRRR